MKIVYLADHPQYASTVAQWIMDKWGHEFPGMTQESIEEKSHTYLNRNAIPLTLLAMVENRPVGTASLVFHDMKTAMSYPPGQLPCMPCRNTTAKASAQNW